MERQIQLMQIRLRKVIVCLIFFFVLNDKFNLIFYMLFKLKILYFYYIYYILYVNLFIIVNNS